MNQIKLYWFAIGGGLLGAFLSSIIAPRAIAWYFDPPVDIGINCRAATEWSMRNLQNAQLTGLLAGAVMGLLIKVVINKKNTGSSSVAK